jgi:hypothetical protein
MVFKIMKAASSFYAVDYNEKKQEQGLAENVYFQNFGYLQDKDIVTKEEFKKYFEDFSSRNDRVKNPQFHAALSCKGDEASFRELKDYAIELMKKLGYGNNPMLIYEHKDTKNNHIHIVTSRVGPDGKKIDHNLEGIRASKILNDILKIDSKQSCKQAIENTLSYSISTAAQFKLLMEQQGYKTNEKENNIIFYRHGYTQGQIGVKQVEEQIAKRTKDTKRTAQIKAFIVKYKQSHNPTISQDKNPNIHTSVKPTYQSDLTNHIQKTFGIQFVFHGERNKDPYGYTIIDHTQKAVYKGSEVMRLEELRKPLSQDQKKDQALKEEKSEKETLSASKPDTNNKENISQDSPTNKPERSADQSINTGVASIVGDTLRDVESEANIQSGKKKRKNQRRL